MLELANAYRAIASGIGTHPYMIRKIVRDSGEMVGDFTLACDAQIYLDLVRAGLRGPEQAQALREWSGFGRIKA